MPDLLLILLWTLITLGVASFATYLGKHYGEAFPIGIMGTLVVIAAILANKLVVIGGYVVPAGVLLASSTFLVTDILSELWGKETAQKAVWVGFYGLIVLTLSLWITNLWEAPVFAQDRAEKFGEVLGMTPRIIFASMAAYLVSQTHDVWSYHLWKSFFNDRHLWFRNNASTIVSQLIDTVIFISVAFYGVLPIGQMIIDMWLIKVCIAILDTPFIYIVSRLAQKSYRSALVPP